MTPDDSNARGDSSARNELPGRLQALIAAAMTGELSEDESRELDDLLRGDDAALELYLKTCQLEAD
jgi:hypothetical protein